MIESIKNLFGKYFQKSAYKKNILTMVGGRVISQVIPILLTPLLTRIYSPGEFGVFAVYSTIVSIFSMLSSIRYCLSIIFAKDEKEAKKLVFLSSSISVLFVTILSIFLFWIGGQFFGILGVEILQKYLVVLILNILIVALFESMFYYVLQSKKYRTFAIISIIQSVSLVVLRLLWGYKINTESGLMISYLISYVVAYILMLLTLGVLKNNSDVKISFKEIKRLLFKYRRFPLFNLPADTLATLTNQSPNLLLNRFFGEINAGYFSLSEKVLGAPLWFVTSSVGDVFKQEAADQYKEKGTCLPIYTKTAKGLFLLGIAPFVAIFLLLPPMIPFLFGTEWEPVGDFVRIFTLMYFAKFVVTPVSYVSYIINKQKYYMYFQAMKFSAIVIGLGIGFYTGNFYLGLILWSALLTIAYVLIYFISYQLVKKASYAPNN